MHFAEQEKQDIFALVAGIMHMGEIKFKQRQREEQAECEDYQGNFIRSSSAVNLIKFIIYAVME